VIQEEKLSDNLIQAVPMILAHWLELYGKEFDSDINGMVSQNNNGEMAYFTLKEDGNILAHIGYFIITAPVYRAKIALDMFYYVKPEARGTMKGVRLLKESAKALLDSGISSVMVSRMVSANLGKIISRAGFVSSGETFIFRG